MRKKEREERKKTSESGKTPSADIDRADVSKTLDDLEKQKQAAQAAGKKRNPFLLAVMILFFPVTGVVLGLRKLFRTINMPLTAKMTLIYSLIFFLVLTAFIIFFVESMRRTGGVSKSYARMLSVMSAVLVVVVSALYAAMVWVTGQFMLKPIRTITDRIDDVTGDNLSARLDQVDSQDELMELTNRINGMLDNLEQSFLRQQNFVADASHELKTPVSVIRGYANMLRRWGKDDVAVRDESIEAIARESENMQRLIEQLLLLARLGNFSLNTSRFNLAEVVDGIVDNYKMVHKEHELMFVCEQENIGVETDKNLFTEALRAIVDNAIKYTPEGGRIRVSCVKRDDGAEISVSDTGIGIKPEDLPHIFERFYRCDKARGREKGSSGLGLSIAKSIVQTMGGKIDVTSTVGVGTTFTIRLPCAA